MCFPKKKLKRKSLKIKNYNPENILKGCRMIVLIDDEPCTKFYRPEYCNQKIIKDGYCEVHKDVNFIKK